jgi:hypothetical protein
MIVNTENKFTFDKAFFINQTNLFCVYNTWIITTGASVTQTSIVLNMYNFSRNLNFRRMDTVNRVVTLARTASIWAFIFHFSAVRQKFRVVITLSIHYGRLRSDKRYFSNNTLEHRSPPTFIIKFKMWHKLRRYIVRMKIFHAHDRLTCADYARANFYGFLEWIFRFEHILNQRVHQNVRRLNRMKKN